MYRPIYSIDDASHFCHVNLKSVNCSIYTACLESESEQTYCQRRVADAFEQQTWAGTPAETITITVITPADRGERYCDEHVCMLVCLSICTYLRPSARVSQKPGVRTSQQIFVHVPCGRG